MTETSDSNEHPPGSQADDTTPTLGDPYIEAVKHALFDRLDGLQETLDELVGQQLGGDGQDA